MSRTIKAGKLKLYEFYATQIHKTNRRDYLFNLLLKEATHSYFFHESLKSQTRFLITP